MSRSIGKDVEHAVNSVIEALVRRMFEIHERLKHKESEFIQIHNSVVNELENNIIKYYENQRFELEDEKGSFEMTSIENDKVILMNEEKSLPVAVDKLDSVIKPIENQNSILDSRNLEKELISELKVMKSAAGYYLGREIVEDGVPLPYDRKSEYFKTEQDAVKALESLIKSKIIKKVNDEVSHKLEKNIDTIKSDNKLVPSQIRAQLEVVNHLKNMSEKDILNAFKMAQKQAENEGTSIEEVYRSNLQRQVNSNIQIFKEKTLDVAIETLEKNKELRKELREVEKNY